MGHVVLMLVEWPSWLVSTDIALAALLGLVAGLVLRGRRRCTLAPRGHRLVVRVVAFIWTVCLVVRACGFEIYARTGDSSVEPYIGSHQPGLLGSAIVLTPLVAQATLLFHAIARRGTASRPLATAPHADRARARAIVLVPTIVAGVLWLVALVAAAALRSTACTDVAVCIPRELGPALVAVTPTGLAFAGALVLLVLSIAAGRPGPPRLGDTGVDEPSDENGTAELGTSRGDGAGDARGTRDTILLAVGAAAALTGTVVSTEPGMVLGVADDFWTSVHTILVSESYFAAGTLPADEPRAPSAVVLGSLLRLAGLATVAVASASTVRRATRP